MYKFKVLPSGSNRFYIVDEETIPNTYLTNESVTKIIDYGENTDKYYYTTRADAQAALDKYNGVTKQKVYVVMRDGKPLFSSLSPVEIIEVEIK